MNLLLIAIGGALGSVARYGTQIALDRQSMRSGFPVGTLVANLVGCLLVGYIHGLLADRVLREEMRFLLVVGFLGGYTTFSSFGWEAFSRLHAGQWLVASLYMALSNVLAIVLVVAGYQISRWHL